MSRRGDDADLEAARVDLEARERLLHHPVRGREDLVDLMAEDFWEVGASGKVYDRESVMQALAERDRVAGVEDWVLSDVACRRLAADTFALTYRLDQSGRVTRRLTLWRRDPEGWRALCHQGTIVQET